MIHICNLPLLRVQSCLPKKVDHQMLPAVEHALPDPLPWSTFPVFLSGKCPLTRKQPATNSKQLWGPYTPLLLQCEHVAMLKEGGNSFSGQSNPLLNLLLHPRSTVRIPTSIFVLVSVFLWKTVLQMRVGMWSRLSLSAGYAIMGRKADFSWRSRKTS